MDDLFRPDYCGPGLAGVDEVGRGPLAGDVVAAAVILDPARPIPGLRDSKKLSPRRREELALLIMEQAQAWSVARASVAEIDELNILQASLLAMHRAVRALEPQPAYVLVDGNRLPRWDYPSEPVVKGDGMPGTKLEFSLTGGAPKALAMLFVGPKTGKTVFKLGPLGTLDALHLATAKGLDVDQPRNLAKSVTVE
jgi:hypothetical protein